MFALSFAEVATAHTSFNLVLLGKTSLSSYKGTADIQGTVDLSFDGTMVTVMHKLTILEEAQCGDAKNACGMRIYEDTTCDDPQGPFGINSTSISQDPWADISYEREAANNTMSKGASSFDVGYNATQVAGRVFVLHDANGTPAACTVIPHLEKRVAPKFSHTDGNYARIGVTGEATIIVSPSTTMHVRFNSSLDTLIVEKSTYVVSQLQTVIAGIPVRITKKPAEFPSNAVWSLLFGPDVDEKSTELTLEVLAQDCRVATTTTSTTTGTAATTATTTPTGHAATTTTSTTTDQAANTSITSTTTTTTTVPAGEPLRRVEAYGEGTSTTEPVHSAESVQTTEDEEDDVCNPGLVCHETLKSCQAPTILPAGSAGTKGDNSNAVQSSSRAILVAMIAYFFM